MSPHGASQAWRIDRHFRNIEIPHTAHKETERSYTYIPAYHDIICEIFMDNHNMSKRDLDLLLYLYRNKYFTFEDVANFPHKPRRWGPVMQKKTIEHFIRTGWMRLYKNNSRSNPRIFSFGDKACVELTRLYRTMYMMDPLGTNKFPVAKRFYDNMTYARAINDINKFIKKVQRDAKQKANEVADNQGSGSNMPVS